MTGDNALRRAEDIGGQELSYAEVKAIASGNPAVLTLAEADAELQRLTLLKKNHADEQYLTRLKVRELPKTIDNLTQRLQNLTTDLQTAIDHSMQPIVIGNRSTSRKDAEAILGQLLQSVPQHVQEIRRISLGVYQGLRFGLILHPQWLPEVYLEGKALQQRRLAQKHSGPRAILNAVERLVGSYRSTCDLKQKDLSLAQTQLRDYQERLGKSFIHESYLVQLTTLRDQLKARLSGMASQESGESLENMSDLASKINVLKAAHTIESAPQRTGEHHSSTEEPITARIRRRREAISTSDDSTGHEQPKSDDTVE